MKEWFNKILAKKYFFGWENIKYILKELVYTFSNKPSIFSSKRIERFLLFLNAVLILDYIIYLNKEKITIGEVLSVFAAQMVYAGYQVTQIRKDIKENKEKKDEELS